MAVDHSCSYDLPSVIDSMRLGQQPARAWCNQIVEIVQFSLLPKKRMIASVGACGSTDYLALAIDSIRLAIGAAD